MVRVYLINFSLAVRRVGDLSSIISKLLRLLVIAVGGGFRLGTDLGQRLASHGPADTGGNVCPAWAAYRMNLNGLYAWYCSMSFR